MTCFTLILAGLLSQTPAAAPAPAPSPADTWQQVQDRYASAGFLGFQAEGRVLSTVPATAGRTIARISAAVEVARSGLGSVELTVRAGQGSQGKDVRLASLGTAEGVFSVDCEQNLAFPCGTDWAASGELDDFAFLGSTWSGAAAKLGAPTDVSFVPAHAGHPGLRGLRVAWAGSRPQTAKTAIFWLDQHGLVSAADLRLDAETVLHWSIRACSLSAEPAEPLQAVALPAGCQRGAGQAVEAVATPVPSAPIEPAAAAPAPAPAVQPTGIKPVAEPPASEDPDSGDPE